jgi:gliding motility-associated-like protein
MPNLELSINPTRVCQGQSATIFASGAQNYQWYGSSLSSTNTSFAVASPSTTTNYTVIGVNSSGTVVCDMAKEITIDVIPVINPTISNSVVICSGESVRLNAGGSNTFLWLPKEGLDDNTIFNPITTAKVNTIYTVTVSDFNFCSVTATVFVKVNPTPTVSAGANAVFNSDEPMYIEAKGTGTLTWIDGVGILCKACPVTQVMPQNSGCYKVQAINEFGCKAIDEVCIEVTNEYNLYIPNVFTPNFDGINDVFKVHGTGITQMELIIFDRWGEELYSTADPDKGWDGTYNGRLSKNDSYVYLVKFTTLGGKKHTKTGHVSLLK